MRTIPAAAVAAVAAALLMAAHAARSEGGPSSSPWQQDEAKTLTYLHSLERDQGCDVVIAGGSTAALAAAITAAVAAPNLTACLTEPTDTLGGQLAWNPAIDFGDLSTEMTQGPELAALVGNLTSPAGTCWVSKACYPPSRLASWVSARLAALPNLRVMLRTAVRGVARDNADGHVTDVNVVTRAPAPAAPPEWAARLSDSLPDWYDPQPSVNFTKDARTLPCSVLVEATEFGDVLGAGGMPFAQGVEIPDEMSTTTDDGLTQSVAFTFFAEMLPSPATSPDPAPRGSAGEDNGAPPFWGAPPGGACCCSGDNALPNNAHTCHGHPLHNNSCLYAGQCSWQGVWRYRRSTVGHAGESPVVGIAGGDVSLQNWGHGNDMPAASYFVPTAQARAEAAAGAWRGGVNYTAMRFGEDRSYGWFRALQAAKPNAASRLVLSRNYSGTEHGLSKFPYLRDTRRAIGIDGYRLNHSGMMSGASHTSTGPHWNDTVGLGGYNFDIKPGGGFGAANGGQRPLPSYLWNATTQSGLSGHAKPFYWPFRALTVNGAPNVLTCGKTSALTFAANTAAREHLSEWSSGVAAGAAAALMAQRGWTTRDALANIRVLQSVLQSPSIGQPLTW